MKQRVRVLLVSAVVATGAMSLSPAPAAADVCQDDGTGVSEALCCENTAPKINGVSRKLLGQDLVACTQ